MKPKTFIQKLSVALLFFAAGAAEAGSNLSQLVVPSPRARTGVVAASPQDRRTEAVAGPCENCGDKKPVTRYRPTVLSFRTKGKPLGPACRSQFIKANGEFGAIGRKIATLIKSPAYKDKFFSGRSLRAFCPRFSKLSEGQQTQAWVWFWMVLANEESTCNVHLPHKTHLPNGKRLNPKPGYGLYAAELYPQHRNWRGKMCQGNIKTADVQVNCAVHTMASTQLSRKRGVRWTGSYWGPIRRAGRQIMPNMEGFKSCF